MSIEASPKYCDPSVCLVKGSVMVPLLTAPSAAGVVDDLAQQGAAEPDTQLAPAVAVVIHWYTLKAELLPTSKVARRSPGERFGVTPLLPGVFSLLSSIS